MLKRYAAFFSFLRSIFDILIVACGWIIVYYIRFYSPLFYAPKGVPSFQYHLELMPPIVVICYLACLWSGLYTPKRIQSILKQSVDLLKATVLSSLLVLSFLYYINSVPYSRKLLAIFAVILFFGLSLSHLLAMATLRFLRRKGYNQRQYAVIGTGEKGQMLVQDINRMSWLGLKCVFFIDNNPKLENSELLGIPVYGDIEKILELSRTKNVDEIYVTLGGNEFLQICNFLESLQAAGVTIRVIPDWGNLMSICTPVTISIGSQLLFSAADSPLTGINIVLKDIFDKTCAFIMLTILAIPMLLIAVLVKLTSKGPIFYTQTRLGMDQKEFKILKFRTMRTDAKKENISQWTQKNDPRRTWIGTFLRGTSLDELPQLINVIKGEMSLVGPRPEQPCFVGKFSENYKKYMLRHKVKAGITGWAQINGFRGDTSIRKRLVYDLYYVKNWSLWFDLWILIQTPWSVIKGKNAY